MNKRAMSAITRVNQLLKQAGREERVVKGRGYMYFRGGEGIHLGSIYAMNLDPTEKDFQFLRSEVNDALASIKVKAI